MQAAASARARPRRPRRAAALCCLLWALLAMGQAALAAGVAYVDLARVLERAPQVAESRSRLEAEFAERNRALEEDELSLDALREEYARIDPLEAGRREESGRRVEALERSLRRRRESLGQELDRRRQQELQRIDNLIGEAITELARERDLDLVLTDQVVYYSPRIDLTDAVVERLDRARADAATED